MTRPPDPAVRAELEELLERDPTRLGEVFRLTRQGLVPEEIARQLGVDSHRFVYNQRICAAALIEGAVPGGPTMARQAASSVRGLTRRARLSGKARAYVDSLLADLETRSGHDTKTRASRARLDRPTPSRSRSPARPGGWRALVEAEIRRRFEPGQLFTFVELFEGSVSRFRSVYPNNTTLQATLLNVLQRLRDDGLLEFVGRGEYRYLAPATSRGDVGSSGVQRLLQGLVERIAEETSIDADDYLDAAASDDPGGAVRELVMSGRTSSTLRQLKDAGHLGLTLERLVTEYPEHFDDDVRAVAQGRLDFWNA